MLTMRRVPEQGQDDRPKREMTRKRCRGWPRKGGCAMAVADVTGADAAGWMRLGGRVRSVRRTQLRVSGASRRGGGWQGSEAQGRQGVKAQSRQGKAARVGGSAV